MEKIAASKFKTTCLSLIRRVQRTRQPVLVTKFGKPVAQLVPAPPPPRPKRWLGDMAGTIKITGDIVAPASDESDWDVFRK